jgi:chromate transporter
MLDRLEVASLTVQPQQGSVPEVFITFLRLGCVSFGGPIAHLGYFQHELVERRLWCDEDTFAELIALAQSLPGPASSQVAFAMGIVRAGWLGGLAAWTGFTLPSAVLMFAFAMGGMLLSGKAGSNLIHGLQIVAVAVVAQAAVTMQRSLAPDRSRIAVALAAMAITLFGPAQFSTLLAIAGGGAAGYVIFRRIETSPPPTKPIPSSKAVASVCACLFFGLLILLPIVGRLNQNPGVQLFSSFYRSGALVFGGGHVVLPLLQNAVVSRGWVTQQSFLAGYGAAQALPGPLFTFAAFLGASVQNTPSRLLFAVFGLVGVSAPGLLAMAAVLPFWGGLRSNRAMQAVLRGVNAAVVGVILAALYSPLWVSTIQTTSDIWFAVAGFALLVVWKVQPWQVVLGVSGCYLAFGFI